MMPGTKLSMQLATSAGKNFSTLWIFRLFDPKNEKVTSNP